MKKTIKNVICIVLMIASIVGMYFTMNYAKNNLGNDMPSMGDNQNTMQSQNNNGSMEEPPEKPDGESNTQNGNSNAEEPPEKPDGESNTQGGNSNTEEPPEKPDGESNTQGGNSNTEEPPAKPDGESSTEGNGSSEQPSMPNDSNNQMQANMNSNKELTTIYYVLFGLESLVLSISFIYLIMSKFNSLAFNEIFTSGDKKLIGVLSILVCTAAFTLIDIVVTNQFFLTSEASQNMNMNQNQNGNSNVEYTASKEITESTTITSGEYSSTEADENSVLINGDIDVSLSNITVNKTGDSDGGDSTSFYGTNSAILAKSGSTLTLSNITVTTNATGANGVFSYGGSATTNNSNSDGTTVNISDSTITTTKDNSGGIMTTGGGTMNATNLTITTAGTSSAAIRSDRGGGTVNVTGGTYTTTGNGSPSVYSTAAITVNDAKLVSKASEGIVIEGKNSVTLNNCTLEDSNTKLNGQSTTYKNIFLYQSMSGDASEGTSSFIAKNSTITTKNGDTFYITNTSATIELENNTIKNTSSDGNFLRIQKDSWGNSGSNGGDVTMKLTNQTVNGSIVVDSISTLDLTLKSSKYEGSINKDNTAKELNITLDSNSTLKLTSDSYVTKLTNSDTTNSNIDFNGYKLYVNGTSIN